MIVGAYEDHVQRPLQRWISPAALEPVNAIEFTAASQKAKSVTHRLVMLQCWQSAGRSLLPLGRVQGREHILETLRLRDHCVDRIRFTQYFRCTERG